MCVKASEMLDMFSNDVQTKTKSVFKWESVLKQIIVIASYRPLQKYIKFNITVGATGAIRGAVVDCVELHGIKYKCVNGIVKVPVNVFRDYVTPTTNHKGRLNLVVRYTHNNKPGATVCGYVNNNLPQVLD